MQLDQSHENENIINDNETYEIFMNDVVMEEIKKRSKINPNVKIETNKNQKFEKNNENQLKEVACSKKIVKTT